MAISDPTTYHIAFDVSAEQYKEMIDEATNANHPTVESWLKAGCKPAPKAQVSDGKVLFHSVVPSDADEKKKK